MALKLITAATVEPITLTLTKLHLRVDHTDEDTLISALISAAREYCEGFQRRSIAVQTWELTMDSFPLEIRLPQPPLVSVTYIKYKDKDGSEMTLSASDYVVNSDEEPGKVVLAYGKSWPYVTLYPTGAIKVRYLAGYTTELVPLRTKQAMLLLIGSWYENREAVNIGKVAAPVPFAVDALLWLDRVM